MSNMPIMLGLEGYPVFTGADFEQASAMVSGIINPHKAWMKSVDRSRLNVRFFASQQGAVTFSYLRYGTEVEISAPDPASCYCLMLPVDGSALVQCGGERILTSSTLASVPSPGAPLRMTWSADAALAIVRIEREAVEEHLRGLVHGPLTVPLETKLSLDFGGPRGSRWRSVFELLRADAAQRQMDPSGLSTRASASVVNELVLNALLLWHPNNYWERLERHDRPARAPYVRHAIDFAREHLGEPITVAMMAQHAGVSIRALQAGFTRDVGCSPSEYVRDIRLDEVRRELIQSDLANPRVTDIALKWGFSHVGRFAHTYHQRFGELPSETLRSRLRTHS
ncbi:AraC family transcriptional regulator [Rhodococcus sp. IEGM 1381]|uniref:AraC family transcriptional regulator n=1 Tax=Rhodococcus sp. IEGM 1381 TaxID=3047085 RepID=UPI0024B6BE95|nr:AraC family transcriptional regulator [Rhodococcus sp. IEGM 1381]MDI9897437.1 AraC family transcriptional regulator [Rhodococcus sp. IEGM 1381]